MELFSKIFKPKSALGLSVHFVNQNEYELAYCLISQAKGQLTLDEFKQINSLDEIAEMGNGQAIFINISGKVVLEKIEDLTEEAFTVQKAFPNCNLDDFYYQIATNENKNIFSLLRKDKVEKVLEELKEQKLIPLYLSLGFAILDNAFENISTLNKAKYSVLGKDILLENSNISEMEGTSLAEQFFDIDTHKLSSHQFVAFAAALNTLNSEEEIISVKEILNEEKEGLKHRLIFDKLKMIIPIFFLIILMVNFLIFSSVLKKNDFLSQEDALNKSTLNKVEALKTEVEKKQAFLKESNWLAQSKVSYYSDQIGLLLPKKISLNELNIFPAKLVKKNNTKEYNFQTNIILLAGFSNSLEELNRWKLILQKQAWVKDVELLSYNQETSKNNISFSLKIKLN